MARAFHVAPNLGGGFRLSKRKSRVFRAIVLLFTVSAFGDSLLE